jgi:hypothetical protein
VLETTDGMKDSNIGTDCTGELFKSSFFPKKECVTGVFLPAL